jgi:phosphohistidine phosphatase
MNLYLLRHADAATVAETDEARCLSEKGLEQAKKVARLCEVQRLQLSLVLTSPVRRAHETALIVSAHLRTKIQVVPWLACGAEPDQVLHELRSFAAESDVMLVGHEPDFSLLAAHLLGLPATASIRVRKASLTRIEMDALQPGTGRLQYSVPCKFL